MNPRPAPPASTGLLRVVYLACGLTLVGLGYLGTIVPGLPVTPFLILASYCFARSSPRLHRWLHRSPVFGRLLSDWETHRGIRRPVKFFAIAMVVVVVSCSIALSGLPRWTKFLIAALALVGIATILMVPTIRVPPRDDRDPPGRD
jgi:hypothetical protein